MLQVHIYNKLSDATKLFLCNIEFVITRFYCTWLVRALVGNVLGVAGNCTRFSKAQKEETRELESESYLLFCVCLNCASAFQDASSKLSFRERFMQKERSCPSASFVLVAGFFSFFGIATLCFWVAHKPFLSCFAMLQVFAVADLRNETVSVTKPRGALA